MNKIFSAIISSPLKGRLGGVLLALLATTTLWAYDFQFGDLYYKITSNSAPYTVEVTYQEYESYSNYHGLTTATIPSTVIYNGTTYSVTSIGDNAFFNCRSLIFITIPNSVTSIGSEAFYDVNNYIEEGFKSITIEATTPPILGSSALPMNLSAIYIPDNTLSAYQQAWGTQYEYVNNENTLTLHVETPGTMADMILDAGTRPINVAKLTLTGALNEADFTCMRETMTSLVDVDLSGITNTYGVNFKNKMNLVRIILPTNLASIGSEAFCDCWSLTSITIGNGVTSIGNDAFHHCFSLTKTNYTGDIASWCNIKFGGDYANPMCCSNNLYINDQEIKDLVIPNTVVGIRDYAFFHCSSFTSVTIGNNVTSIGYRAFSYCGKLNSITISNSITSIGANAFEYCSSLTSITIPNSVENIGEYALRDCRNLTSIICLGTTPPNASNLGVNTTTCTLNVPQSAYNAYLRHNYWGQFLNINTGYLVTLQTNNDQWGEVAGTNLYTQDTTITITATPNEGYAFMRWSDGNTDNPRTIQVTSDTTLTAEFAIEGGCLVTFVDWDGTVLSTVSVVPGDAATAPADPTREGYTFIGWDKDFSHVTDHMTVTAQYQINRYRVRFFDYDNTLLKTDSVEYQAAATAPANPYREGYTFIGWDQKFDSITVDLDVYAQYEFGEDRDMTIVFANGNDNTEIYSQSISIKMPPAPEIEGFTFLGWQPVATVIKDVITIQAIYEANTQSATEEVYTNPANPAQKLLRNGQVYILQDGKTYTITGQKL